jgi:hypothetical protein
MLDKSNYYEDGLDVVYFDNLLKSRGYKNYQLIRQTRFYSYDVLLITENGRRYGIELKMRNKDYDTIILEKAKLDGAVEKLKTDNLDGIFYYSFVEGTNIFYQYDLEKVFTRVYLGMLKMYKKWLPDTNPRTLEKKLVLKDVFFLPKRI